MTQKINVPSNTWTEVVTSDTGDFLLDNPNNYKVEVVFSATTPASNSAYHTLESGQGLVRVAEGKVWARGSGVPALFEPIFVVVSQ